MARGARQRAEGRRRVTSSTYNVYGRRLAQLAGCWGGKDVWHFRKIYQQRAPQLSFPGVSGDVHPARLLYYGPATFDDWTRGADRGHRSR
eukprot:CAMPEP_0113677120 /NCGR_PEP_ID=MMETSP0038_2-20120614/9069_1 /TAXON_ID=2898 /ORGANISM="Cryptomonas paramecium" /LENGTH=89 /DNA_ID=CAMNT_0000594319 /DNA_START=51 /DNA_END=317 /DNA_ORIENTATION=+ /assembly_acc=CAM_ASM_000170